MNAEERGDRARIERALEAAFAPLALAAGMELDVFSALAEGPLEAGELAERQGLDAARLEAVLRALVVDGWLELEDGRFRNARAADRFLVRGREGSLAGAQELHLDLWAALLRTADSVRAGAPQARHDFSAMSEEQLGAFYRGLHPLALAAGRRLWERHDLAGARRLLDVGGGSGAVAIAACERHPELRATVAELSRVAPWTRRFVEHAGLAERVAVRACDAVREPLEGEFDVAVLRAFLQVLGPEACRAALRNVAAALRPGGTLLVVSRALDDDRLNPPEVVRFDLVFVNLYDAGRAWTESQHRAWMTEAGFEAIERTPFGSGASLFRARRA